MAKRMPMYGGGEQRIESCGECHYRVADWQALRDRCGHFMVPPLLPEEGIPEWCPLVEWEDE